MAVIKSQDNLRSRFALSWLFVNSLARFLKVVEPIHFFFLSLPSAALAVNVTVQVLLLRQFKGKGYMRSMFIGFGIGLLALTVVEGYFIFQQSSFSEAAADVFARLVTYGALSYCYFHFVNLGQSSIRIRVYSEIAASPHGLGIEALKRDYNDSNLANTRLARLLKSGDIVEKEGLYTVGRNRLVMIANVLFFAKRFLLRRHSEFDSQQG